MGTPIIINLEMSSENICILNMVRYSISLFYMALRLLPLVAGVELHEYTQSPILNVFWMYIVSLLDAADSMVDGCSSGLVLHRWWFSFWGDWSNDALIQRWRWNPGCPRWRWWGHCSRRLYEIITFVCRIWRSLNNLPCFPRSSAWMHQSFHMDQPINYVDSSPRI